MGRIGKTLAATPDAAAGREQVGQRLRALRKQRGLTLKMLAEQSGVALSTISKIELGQIAVSYEKFSALARTLDVDPSRLFDGAVDAAPGRTVVKTVPAAVSEYRTGSYGYRMLAAGFPHKKMTPMLGQVAARGKQEFADYVRHPGEEFVLVLSGQVRIEFENGEAITLKRHESAYFDSGVGHLYISVGRGQAEMIVVCADR